MTPAQPLLSFAQNAEDVVLMRALRHIERGCYVDVGAAGPANDSVTRMFYDRGWAGINIEPDPVAFAELARARPRDRNLQMGAGSRPERMTFHRFPGTGLSTFDADNAARWTREGLPCERSLVPVVPLSAVFDQMAMPVIHFLKIDVEGFERDVLEGVDFARHRPWIIVIAATRPNTQDLIADQWEGLLATANYRRCLFDGINLFYCAGEHPELLPNLVAPANVLDNYLPVRHLHVQRLLEETQLHANVLHRAYQAERSHRAAMAKVPGKEVPTPPAAFDANPVLQAPARTSASTLFFELNNLRTVNMVTGIERVGLNLVATLKQLEAELPLPVIFTTRGSSGFLRLPVTLDTAGETATVSFGAPTEAIRVHPGDIWINCELDYRVHAHAAWYERLREAGVNLHFWVYDLFPIRRPEWSTRWESVHFNRWFERVSTLGNGLICISATVAGQVRSWLQRFPPAGGEHQTASVQITHLHLGADNNRYQLANGTAAPAERADGQPVAIEELPRRPTFLSVASVHPRKGLPELLAAFELLWARDLDVQLVLTGRIYATAESIGARILSHPEQGKRLFYLGYRPDAELEALYRRSDALVYASYDEGFGLPAIEAAARNLPVIQRKTYIFQEIAGDNAFWFEDTGAAAIAAAIEEFIALPPDRRRRVIPASALWTWEQTTRRMLSLVGIEPGEDPTATGAASSHSSNPAARGV